MLEKGPREGVLYKNEAGAVVVPLRVLKPDRPIAGAFAVPFGY